MDHKVFQNIFHKRNYIKGIKATFLVYLNVFLSGIFIHKVERLCYLHHRRTHIYFLQP